MLLDGPDALQVVQDPLCLLHALLLVHGEHDHVAVGLVCADLVLNLFRRTEAKKEKIETWKKKKMAATELDFSHV